MPYAMPPLDPAIRADVLDKAVTYIREHSTCFLLTYRPDGYSRLYGMGYLLDGLTFFMSTFREMTKAADLATNARATLFLIDQRIRPDHFIQVDTAVSELTDEELEPWQQRRFEKWPHEVDALARQNRPWVGWLFEPIRLRVNGYITGGAWHETPVVFSRQDLGLAPLAGPPDPGDLSPSPIAF
jgi:hypothetical protein